MTALPAAAEDGFGDLPLRDDLRGKVPYGAPQLPVAVRLNTNENPYPPSAGLVAELVDAVRVTAGGLNRYPDRDAMELRSVLAGYLGVHSTQVWAANGSNEVLAQLLQAFGGPGRTAMGFVPSYSMHQEIAGLTGTAWRPERRSADFGLEAATAVAAVERDRPDVVLLTRPNNPTGSGMPLELVVAVCAAAPGVVIVDEAYAEFSREPSAVSLLAEHPLLVVTRTMSKAFALAGGRLGYLAASPSIVQALQLVRLPYHLSALTQTAALVALSHRAETLATVSRVVASRDRLADALRERGIPFVPSDGNFLLVGGADDGLWKRLLDRGVLVRDVGIPGHLRVTVGTEAECEAYLTALAAARRAVRG